MGVSAFKLISPGSDGKSIRNTIELTSHGFVAGDVLRYYVPVGAGSEGWTAAIADSALGAEVAGVVETVTENAFVIVYGGEISLSDFSNGITTDGNDVFFLSDTDPGQLTGTPPINGGSIIKPILTKVSDETAIVTNYIGTAIGGRATVSLDQIQPVGTIMPYAGDPDLLPSGWGICDGSFLSTTDYQELYERIGTKFGVKQTLEFDTLPAGAIVGDTVLQGSVSGTVESIDGTTVVVTVDHLDTDADGNNFPNGDLFTDGNITIDDASGNATVTVSSFAKPDLQTRTIIGVSAGSYVLGELGGAEEITLSASQLPTTFLTSSGDNVGITTDSASPLGGALNSSGGNEHPNMPPFMTLYYIIKLNSLAQASYVDGLDLNLTLNKLADTEDTVYDGGDIIIYDRGTINWRPYNLFEGYEGWTADSVRGLYYQFPGKQTSRSLQVHEHDGNGGISGPAFIDGTTIDSNRGFLTVGKAYEKNWTIGYEGSPAGDYGSFGVGETTVLNVVGDITLNSGAWGSSKILGPTSKFDPWWGTTLDYAGHAQWIVDGDGAYTYGTIFDNSVRGVPQPPNVFDLSYNQGRFVGVDYNTYPDYGYTNIPTDKLEAGYDQSILLSSRQGIHLCLDHEASTKPELGVGYNGSNSDAIFTIGGGGLGYGPRGANTGGYDRPNSYGDLEHLAEYTETVKIVSDTGQMGFLCGPEILTNASYVSSYPTRSDYLGNATTLPLTTGIGVSGGVLLRRGSYPIDGILDEAGSVLGVPADANSYEQRHSVPSVYALNQVINGGSNVTYWNEPNIAGDITDATDRNTIRAGSLNADTVTKTGLEPGLYKVEVGGRSNDTPQTNAGEYWFTFNGGTDVVNIFHQGDVQVAAGGGEATVSAIVRVNNTGTLTVSVKRSTSGVVQLIDWWNGYRIGN